MSLDFNQGYALPFKLGSGLTYEKPQKYSTENAARDTRRALEFILPSEARIFRDTDEALSWDNAISKRNLLLIGSQETGKSHTARWIALQAYLKYYDTSDKPIITAEALEFLEKGKVSQGRAARDEPGFYALRHGHDVLGLLNNLDNLAQIQIIFAEDLTARLDTLNKKEKARMANEWFKIRHKLRAAIQSQTGFIMGILALHRFHGTPPALNTDSDLLIFKSVPSNPYDEGVFRKYIGDAGIAFLDMIETRAKKDLKYKGYGVWYHKRKTGVWYNPAYMDQDLFKTLETGDPDTMEKTEKPSSIAEIEFQPTVEGYDVEPKGSWKDPEFIIQLVQELKVERGTKSLEERDKKIFLEAVTTDQAWGRIGARHGGISRTRVGQIVKELKQLDFGYAAERAYSRRHPEYEYQGKNEALPDFLDHQGKKVISFKCYDDEELTENTTWICDRVGKNEMKYAQANGYSLEMLAYEIRQQRFFHYLYHPKDTPTQRKQPDPAQDPNTRSKYLALEEGLNPLLMPAARDILQKTLKAAAEVLVKGLADKDEALERAIEHTLENIKELHRKGDLDTETRDTLIKYLQRYREAPI